ncbi:MAG: 30S ribosomal protein S18 [Oligoflexales bacterium]|nr:30S ribosomal protein S18 [Oligoflexales bacterium]
MVVTQRKKRRVMFRRKRALDPTIAIDYKNPDMLKRFITDRGKIIPRRISGATASQQRAICKAVKRARYLALLPFCLSHRTERNFAAEMSAIATSSMGTSRSGSKFDRNKDRTHSKQNEENSTTQALAEKEGKNV